MQVRSHRVMLVSALVSLCALVLAPSQARAQGTLLAVDQTVRMHLMGGGPPLEGRLATMTPEAWVVETASGEFRSVEPAQINEIEVQVFRRATRKGFAIGGAAGLGIGVALVTIQKTCGEPPEDYSCDRIGAADALLIAVGGALIGSGVGYLITSEPWVPGVFVDYYQDQPDRFGLQWSVGWRF